MSRSLSLVARGRDIQDAAQAFLSPRHPGSAGRDGCGRTRPGSARRPCPTGCLPDDLPVALLLVLDDVARHHHRDQRLVVPRLRHLHQDRGGDSHHQHQDHRLLPGHHHTPR